MKKPMEKKRSRWWTTSNLGEEGTPMCRKWDQTFWGGHRTESENVKEWRQSIRRLRGTVVQTFGKKKWGVHSTESYCLVILDKQRKGTNDKSGDKEFNR